MDMQRVLFGVRFPRVVGVAAGVDKNATRLLEWERLGFGFVEIGTITPVAQQGTGLLYAPESGSWLINQLGFNNEGAMAVEQRLVNLRKSGQWVKIPVGISIGKNTGTRLEAAALDYIICLERLWPYADFFVLNVSSPNTPQLRQLQACEPLDALFEAVQERNRRLPVPRPILVKIAPDLSWNAIAEIVSLVEKHGLAGIVATNTTVDQSSLPEVVRRLGGLSGQPLRARATEVVRFIASRTTLPVIAVGGVDSAESVREKLDAGAALVQICTGLILHGPDLAGRLFSRL